MPKDSHPIAMGVIESADNGIKEKFKCGLHNFYTNDAYDFDQHMRDKNLKHYVVISNGKCFYCGDVLNADESEGVEYRHFVEGKATHKVCREKMYADIHG